MEELFKAAWPFVLVAGVVLGAWFRIEKRIERGERELKETDASHAQEIAELERDFSNYKLQATAQFASVSHMKDVEVRLTGSIDRLTNRIEALPREFAEQVARILSAHSK